MCGIAGYWSPERRPARAPADMREIVRRMTATIRHRGPDDEGHHIDADVGLALGHRRLAILDLSPEGHQPMVSRSGRYWIVFNGEVFNFLQIRAHLMHFDWRGRSDTEVMLAAIEKWGLREAVQKFIGMFAFALWDSFERKLYLVRDRLGIKPLYYGWANGTFLFASELKALGAHPEFEPAIDRDSLASYLRLNHVPGPLSIYRGVRKLMPATILTVNSANPETSSLETYWSACDYVRSADLPLASTTDEEVIAQLHDLLQDAVRLRMVSDVPIGAFLSGGIDSTTVVALMQSMNRSPVRTFSIGFSEGRYDESKHARGIAKFLGTDHVEQYVSPSDALNLIPQLPAIYDEPFADASQIPTTLVSMLARRSVTVALSGDGGDELFCGYESYPKLNRIWIRRNRIPPHLRNLFASFAGMGTSVLGMRSFCRLGLGKRPHEAAVQHLARVQAVLKAHDIRQFKRAFQSYYFNSSAILVGVQEELHPLPRNGNRHEDLTAMMLDDVEGYLPGDILTKLDRASMTVGLEARVPLLDHRVVEFALKLPTHYKVRDGQTKWLLRQVLYKYVPKNLVERPKQGFAIPLSAWLKGPLREWAEELLNESRLSNQGMFQANAVRRLWQEHLAGQWDWSVQLWGLLVFQQWMTSKSGAPMARGAACA
jgi:asparagine synthase (glutamine-hydrolysing)